jgi:putative transposase
MRFSQSWAQIPLPLVRQQPSYPLLLRLKERGLHGVEFVVSDDHAGLKKAISEVLTEAAWQRCYVHVLRNSLDYLPRKADDDCLQELRWIYDRRDLQEANRDLAAWIAKWQTKYPKLVGWVESNIGETLSFYRLPRAHHKHLKSSNMLERLNEEIKRRLRLGCSPATSRASRRTVPEPAAGTTRCLGGSGPLGSMSLLAEQKKELLRAGA